MKRKRDTASLMDSAERTAHALGYGGFSVREAVETARPLAARSGLPHWYVRRQLARAARDGAASLEMER